MKETRGYVPGLRRCAPVVLTAAAMSVGIAACGDDGQGSLLNQGPPPTTTTQAPATGSSIRVADGGTKLVNDSGRQALIDPKLVTGYVDAASVNGEYVDLSGWAAPADLSQPADLVVAMAGGKAVATIKPSGDRPDLVDGYDRPGLQKAGFSMSVPRAALDCAKPDQGLTTYGVAGSAAGPLKWLADVPKHIADAC